MKKTLFIIFICTLVSFTTKYQIAADKAKQHVFLLSDSDISKFQLIDSVTVAYQRGTIINSPIVAIDGIVFDYDKNKDTIVLPIRKNDIADVAYVDKSGSSIIYGRKETNGAIIINTLNLK